MKIVKQNKYYSQIYYCLLDFLNIQNKSSYNSIKKIEHNTMHNIMKYSKDDTIRGIFSPATFKLPLHHLTFYYTNCQLSGLNLQIGHIARLCSLSLVKILHYCALIGPQRYIQP